MKLRLGLLATLALASTASAATFDTAPASHEHAPGDGPYSFVGHSTDPGGSYAGFAYKVPTEEGWHRCIQSGSASFTVPDLPDGNYPVAIANDVSINWYAAHGQLYSGTAQSCQTTNPPDGDWTVFWLNVYTPPPPAATPPEQTPTDSQPEPTPQDETPAADPCADNQTAVRRATTALAKARAKYRKHHTARNQRRVKAAGAELKFSRKQLTSCREFE